MDSMLEKEKSLATKTLNAKKQSVLRKKANSELHRFHCAMSDDKTKKMIDDFKDKLPNCYVLNRRLKGIFKASFCLHLLHDKEKAIDFTTIIKLL